MDLYKKFKRNIFDIAELKNNDKLLLSVSGGPDSLVMFDLALRLREDYGIDLGVFHLDHCLRDESDTEAEMVREICRNNQVVYWIKKEDISNINAEKSGSIEAIAREVRFNHLKKIYFKGKFDGVLTGHQANDQIETMLFNLFRGSGLEGLTGMNLASYYDNMFLIKPLLNIWREEIENYCNKKGLRPSIDKSNYTLKYTRNRIRNELIPYLEEHFNDSIKLTLYDTINLIRDEHRLINSIVDDIFIELMIESGEGYLDLDIKKLYSQDIAIQRRVIRKSIFKTKGNLDGIYQKHISILTDAIKDEVETKETGKDYQMPGGVTCRVEYNTISFRTEEWYQKHKTSYFKVVIPDLGEYTLPDGNKIGLEKFKINQIDWKKYIKMNIIFIDYDELEWPLVLRHRKAGDRFKPLKMEGTKKIKDYFIDSKIPKYKRDKTPILVDAKDRIIWLVGERMDDRFKIDSKTQNILMVKYEFKKEGE